MPVVRQPSILSFPEPTGWPHLCLNWHCLDKSRAFKWVTEIWPNKISARFLLTFTCSLVNVEVCVSAVQWTLKRSIWLLLKQLSKSVSTVYWAKYAMIMVSYNCLVQGRELLHYNSSILVTRGNVNRVQISTTTLTSGRGVCFVAVHPESMLFEHSPIMT